jgi:hypothetical protein
MNKIILVLIGMLLINSVQGQRWQKTIGYPNRKDESNNLLEHYDHGYLITGLINEGYDNTHGWLVKTDINGEVLWDKQIALLPDQTIIVKTLYDEQGNIYLLGWLVNLNFVYDFPLIVKLNACGEKLWCRMFAIEGYTCGDFRDAIILENGDLLCLAYMPEDDMSNNNRILLFRVSSDGDCIWKKGYATHENHPYYGDPNGISLNQFGIWYIISGNVYSPYPNSPNPYHVYQRPMFIGIDEEFEEKWIVEFGISDSLLGRAESVVPISDTLFLGVGRYRYIDESGIMTASPWLMFFNHLGEQVGYNIIDDEQLGPEVLGSALFEVEHIDSCKYFFSSDFMYDEEGNYANGEIVVDTSGNVYHYAIRENTIGGQTDLVKTYSNKYAIACNYKLPNALYDILLYKINKNLEHDTLYPGNYTYDSLCRHTIESGIIDLAGCDVITSIGEIPTLEEYNKGLQSIPIKASPNPSSTGEIMLEMENTGLYTNMQLEVFDVFGKQIHHEKVYPHQGATRLDVSNWPGGMYVVTIYTNGQVRGKCKVVVE